MQEHPDTLIWVAGVSPPWNITGRNDEAGPMGNFVVEGDH